MPRYRNPNPHPIVVSITEPRISVTVFPFAWAKTRLPTGARQEVELDAVLARPFLRMHMLEQSPAEITASAPTPPPMPAATSSASIAVDPAAPPLDLVISPDIVATQEVVLPESPLAVTEENISPADLALSASTDSQRARVVNRPPSPPRKRRYNL
jgi:hypothetical protein